MNRDSPRNSTRRAGLPMLDRLGADRLQRGMAPMRRRLTTRRPVAFWIVAYLFASIMLGTTLPTPLYVIYQAKWHFSSGIITIIFASYAVGVLTALLLAGRSSDQVGRRPVLFAALAFSAISTVVFIVLPGVGWLFVGRVLSGISAGLVTGTATATLTDIYNGSSPRRPSMVATAANMGGLGLGPLLAGLFAQFGPHPTVLVFEVYLAVLAVAVIGLVVVPEPVSDRHKLSLRFTGLGIPRVGRSEFIAAGVAGFAAFSLLGMFTALAPTFLGSVLHEHSHAVGGAIVFTVFGVAAATQLVLARFPSRTVVVIGLSVFLSALALIVAGLSQASLAIFLTGAIVGGVAVGAVFIGSLSTANRLAPAEIRARVASTYFVFAYVGLTVPVIGVGVGSQYEGDFRAVLVCAIVLAALCALSAAAILRASGGDADAAHPDRV
jgi:MFS family permease